MAEVVPAKFRDVGALEKLRPGGLESGADFIARQLADGPPLLYPAIKQLLRHSEMLGEHEAFELHDSLHAVQKVVRSDDLKEGARAFSAKRRPVWKGQ
jgi:crotonobetainyl-CoA hydratase